ncbi:MAG: hypothetical protein ACYC33_08680 [Thermoleophilia bacterium]
MADKKVERNVRSSDQERPSTPTQKMTAALSDTGTVNMAHAEHDKGKAALFDRFRDRDERYRQEQSAASLSAEAATRAGSTTPDDEGAPKEGTPEETPEDEPEDGPIA